MCTSLFAIDMVLKINILHICSIQESAPLWQHIYLCVLCEPLVGSKCLKYFHPEKCIIICYIDIIEGFTMIYHCPCYIHLKVWSYHLVYGLNLHIYYSKLYIPK